jgi:hypothetical protein
MVTAELQAAQRGAEELWWARLDRAQSEDEARAGALERWHLLILIDADMPSDGWPAGGYTPNPKDAGHQEREVCRVLSELGELYGIGPFPAPG